MNRISTAELPQFVRRYRFPGGRLRVVRVVHKTAKDTTLEFRLVVREATTKLGEEAKTVRLRLRVSGVEEFRFQMRPQRPKVRIAEARFAVLNGLFYITFDALILEPGDRPALHDFRASEVYAAGRELLWEEVIPKSK